MPLVSKAQQRFMFANHPDIAKRWMAEYPENLKGLPEHKNTRTIKTPIGKTTPTNESNNPKVAKLPRLSGTKRDFGSLHPTASARMVPKSKAHPNLMEAEKNYPVTFHPDSYPGKLGKPGPHFPNHRGNVKKALSRLNINTA